MWQDKLKEIIYILENSNVNEIEVSFWGRKYRVVKKPNTISELPVQKSKNITLDTKKDNKGSENNTENDKNKEIKGENYFLQCLVHFILLQLLMTLHLLAKEIK